MLSFGPYKFVPTSLKYNKKNRWSVIECIDVMPSLQNIGQGVENIELEITIYLNSLKGLNQLKNMKEAEKDQIPHTLVDSLGNFLGQFVITQLEERQISFFPGGLPKKVEFSLSLKSYSGTHIH
ncbi:MULTISPECIES: phage tail protein [unclassified Wolbachia]|uniref:phage tail protein n=1 Tax=unclassified Wolbachia TaxID=2640676 RepID=UPI0007EED1E9|nr:MULTISPECIES: phage tail protein [unclassified Wolbachia]MCX3064951.1 phage tail protein [Wolbachia endosymbiont of Drosophila pseudotakahashii]MCX3065772.1 phage tail protein [Wolbachia endosymbiont of Drosophila pseudotakahashii]UZE38740.1 phage tail protein [Wolbachia endosymbiont of Drosophila pseudotakahashii]UZE38838.1 phage tail protein [Wolbachia endosymbiont of Drosophila pseudotakahashii]UZE39108.1 phage tail protein [Wolbachia endosymbiont of Drosophila pseudotakahashii]